MTTSLASPLFARATDEQILFGRFRQTAALHGVVDAVEALDVASSGHSRRVANLAVAIAVESGRFTRAERAALHEASLLHDVGKVAVPAAILTKPGRLTEDEFDSVKLHAPIGGLLVSGVLTPEQAHWVRHHHERWDGSGYPDGIPTSALHAAVGVMCLADSFDAMTTRSYSREMTVENAAEECLRRSGAQFAPAAVTALLRLVDADALPEDEAGGEEVATWG